MRESILGPRGVVLPSEEEQIVKWLCAETKAYFISEVTPAEHPLELRVIRDHVKMLHNYHPDIFRSMYAAMVAERE